MSAMRTAESGQPVRRRRIGRWAAAIAVMSVISACSSSKTPATGGAATTTVPSSSSKSASSGNGAGGGCTNGKCQMTISFNISGALSINGDLAIPIGDCVNDPEQRDLVDGKDTWGLPNGKDSDAADVPMNGHSVAYSVILKPFKGPGTYDQSSIDGNPYPFLSFDDKQVGFGTSSGGATSDTTDSAVLRADGSGSLTLNGELNGTVTWTCGSR